MSADSPVSPPSENDHSSSVSHVLHAIHQRARVLMGAPADPASPPPQLSPKSGRMQQLSRRFDLSPLEERLLLCLFRAEYDPLLRLLIRSTQGAAATTLELGTIVELLELSHESLPLLAALLDGGAKLVRESLIAVDPRPAVAAMRQARLHPGVARYLVGIDGLTAGMQLVEAPSGGPLDAEVERVVWQLERACTDGERPVLEIVGTPGVGRRQMARKVAGALGRPLLVLDLAVASAEPAGQRAHHAQLEARLHDALLCLVDWNEGERSVGGDEGPSPTAPPSALATALLDRRPGDLTILCTRSSLARALHGTPVPLFQLAIAFPTPAERAQLLRDESEAHGGQLLADDLDLLARRFALPPNRLRAAVRTAHRAADARGGILDVGDLAAACRAQLDHDLDGIADRITSPERMSDLVVSEEIAETLAEMVGFVRDAKLVHDDWGFGRRRAMGESISALFAGPPGTGKTMCASVIANELSTELFRVDLSRVVSKWIGETEKNLSRVFDEAERSSSVLLFDEADSLFAKRTAVQTSSDRYANLAVNYLLQRLETFRGMAILTTNYETSIDPAFKRRLTFRVRFEKPDVGARAELWRKVFPATARLAADIDVEKLALLADLSGAGIRNAAVRAAFLAASRGGPIDMDACATATLREAAEMGMLAFSAPRAPSLVSFGQRIAG